MAATAGIGVKAAVGMTSLPGKEINGVPACAGVGLETSAAAFTTGSVGFSITGNGGSGGRSVNGMSDALAGGVSGPAAGDKVSNG